MPERTTRNTEAPAVNREEELPDQTFRIDEVTGTDLASEVYGSALLECRRKNGVLGAGGALAPNLCSVEVDADQKKVAV